MLSSKHRVSTGRRRIYHNDPPALIPATIATAGYLCLYHSWSIICLVVLPKPPHSGRMWTKTPALWLKSTPHIYSSDQDLPRKQLVISETCYFMSLLNQDYHKQFHMANLHRLYSPLSDVCNLDKLKKKHSC